MMGESGPHVLFMMLLLLGSAPSSDAIVTTFNITANTSGVQHNGDAAATLGQTFSVTLTLNLAGAFNPSWSPLILNVTLEWPGVWLSEQSCTTDQTYINGSDVQTGCTTEAIFYELAYIPNQSSNTPVVGSDIVLLSAPEIHQGFHDGNITIEFTILNITDTVDSVIEITFHDIGFMDTWRRQVINTFTADVYAEYDNVTVYDDTRSVDVALIGSDLLASVTKQGGVQLQAGDWVKVTLDCQHSAVSTEAALNVTIWLNLPYDNGLSVNSASYFNSVTNTYDNITSWPWSFDIANLSMSDHIEVELNFTATDDIPLQLSVSGSIGLSWKSNVDAGMLDYLKNFYIETAELNFTDSGSDVATLASDYVVGDTFTLRKSFTMPLGTLNSLQFIGEFSSLVSFNGLPLKMTESTMTVPPYVQVDSSKVSVTTSDVQHTYNNRRRRSAVEKFLRVRRASDLSVVRDFGSFVNPSNGGQPNAPIDLDLTFEVTEPQGNGGTVDADLKWIMDGHPYLWIPTQTMTIYKPELVLYKSVEIYDDSVLPNLIRINFTVEHTAASLGAADNTRLTDSHAEIGARWNIPYTGPPYGDAALDPNSGAVNSWTWTENSLTSAETMFMSLVYTLTNDGADVGTDQHFSSVVRYSSGIKTYTASDYICIRTENTAEESVLYNYGFTVLVLLVGILFGIFLLILIIIICIKCCRHVPFSKVEPYQSFERTYVGAKGGHLVINSNEASSRSKKATRSGYDNMKTMSSVGVSDSIVKVLAMKDGHKIRKELDSLDLVTTSVVDEDLEKERNQAIMSATFTLLQNMEKNGDLSSKVTQQGITKFQRASSDLDKKLDQEYKDEVALIYTELSKKNRSKLDDLLRKQEERREEMEERLKNLPTPEREELMEELKKEQDAEQEQLNSLLGLEQTERIEETRKEFDVKKQFGLQELQHDTIELVKEEGKLTSQQADWMMQQHLNTQVEVKRIYNDEVARQRMILNEKLERRKLLAQQAASQSAYHNELIDMTEKQEVEKVKKMLKAGELAENEAEVIFNECKRQTQGIRVKMEKEKNKSAEELHKKLNDRKKKRMEEKARKQEQELQELDKKQKEMTNKSEYVDPVKLISERQVMISNHRAELIAEENDIDKEQVIELVELLDTLVDHTRQELDTVKVNVTTKLKDAGIQENQMKKLIAKHEKEVANLEETRAEEKENQERKFKDNLDQRRRELVIRKEQKDREHEQLQAQEEKVVRKLMENQVSISEDEREKILKEHEKHMVKLEASLTLNRLQQQRMLEERMAQKRQRRMEELQRAHTVEAKKSSKKASADSDVDDEEMHDREITLLRQQAKERQDLLQQPEEDDELSEIEFELMKEREGALKDQEVKLGAMLAELQMTKAKEMSRIEEQQMAIHNLKSNLMEDLNDKGILSGSDCQKVIELHQQEQEQLAEKIEAQRVKQEKLLRQRIMRKVEEREELLRMRHEMEGQALDEQALRNRLQQRLKQKESNLADLHEAQIKKEDTKTLSPAAKIRRMALLTRQQQEMVQFRNRMELEIEQTLAELRRQNDLRRMKAVQGQEIQFINGLVRMGKFKLDELENVVHLLFPNKTEDEKRALIEELTEGYKPKESKNPERVSSLVERVKMDTLRRSSLAPSEERGPRKKKLKKRTERYEDEDYYERPEPVGRSRSPQYDESPTRGLPPPPTRLAPLDRPNKKKKKKRQTYDDDDDF